MVTYYKLDKVITVGESWRAEENKFYVIKAIGTDASPALTPYVERYPLGAIRADVAPLHKTSSNLLGPLDLGALYYVVPPKHIFKVAGPSGAKCRIIGRIGVLGPGEALPAGMMERFGKQPTHHLTYVTDSESLGTDETWTAGREFGVYKLTPLTPEVYKFNNVCMVSVTGDTISEGQVGIRFYLEAAPFDILETTMGKLGVDALSMPHPPRDVAEEIPFSLEDLPIEVKGDKTFEVRAINVSGGDLPPATGAAWTVKFTAVVEYLKRP